jgi:cytochrome P450
MNPQFRRERIETLRGIIVATIDELVDELGREVARSPGGVVEISAWTAQLLSTLTIRMLFGTELDSGRADEVREALSVMLDHLIAGMVTRKLPRWLPMPGTRRFTEARELVNRTILEIIERRRHRQEPGEDLLGLLIEATDDQGALSDRQLRDEVVTTYIAGYETTAWALAWTLWQLGKQPAITRAIQAELEHEDDPLKVPLIDAAFCEGLRLFPSAPILPRLALNDEELRGHPIPEGTIVVTSPWLVHRNPEIWPDPDRYDPQRFLDEEQVAARHRQAWMPFGAGQRICIGKGLALMEGRLALGELLRRFTPSPAPGPEPQIRLSTTLRARDGIPIVLEPR